MALKEHTACTGARMMANDEVNQEPMGKEVNKGEEEAAPVSQTT